MKKIAIFSTGSSPAALRVTSLFNEGNRIRVVAVVGATPEVAAVLKETDPDIIIFSQEEWDNAPGAILNRLQEMGVEKIAVEAASDSAVTPVFPCDPGLMETFILSSEEAAPREVVDAFKVETTPPAIPNPSASPATPDEEWAKVLKVNFDSSVVQNTPPPIPTKEENQTANLSAAQNQINPRQPAPTIESPQEPMPKAYLVWAVVMTVFCCMIPGIVAIIFSSQVSSKYWAGDIEGSKKASERAQIWIIVSFVLGVLSNTLALPIALIG